MKFLESSCRHPNVQAELRTSGLRERNHAVGKGCACVLSCFSCVRLCNSVDCSPPGSPVHGISQARILGWVAMPSSRGISLTQGSNPHPLHLLHWQVDSLPLNHREEKMKVKYKQVKTCLTSFTLTVSFVINLFVISIIFKRFSLKN